jgi:hypothetical protein
MRSLRNNCIALLLLACLSAAASAWGQQKPGFLTADTRGVTGDLIATSACSLQAELCHEPDCGLAQSSPQYIDVQRQDAVSSRGPGTGGDSLFVLHDAFLTAIVHRSNKTKIAVPCERAIRYCKKRG